MGFWKKLFGGGKDDAGSKEVVSPREYLLREVEAALAEDPSVEEVGRLKDDYGLHFTRDGESVQTFLDNLFAETRELSPEQRSQVIRRFLGAFAKTSDRQPTWEEVQSQLLPVVRAAAFGVMAPPADSPTRTLVARHTLPFLRELLVVDQPDASMYVQYEHLNEWGVSEEEAFVTAFANLASIRDVGVDLQEERPSPIWSVDSEDSYETSRLLLPGFLASFAGRVSGRPIAVIPTRSTLVIAGDQDAATVSRLCELGEREFDASARSISPALYTVDDAGRVVPYRRPGQDALALRIRRTHVRLAMGEYTAQKEFLDEQHEAKEVDLFVASYGALVREKDESPLSWCSWSDDVDALLPETDVVVLALGEEDLVPVPFSVVQRLAPGCLTRVPELWPVRYRTTAWPQPKVLEQLRAAAVDISTYEVP
ncbi:hypothetical protein MYSTI_07645 [Myxococcus stipitatus DSM 14675]|uniref:DUF1444 domain-containing protein n=1 Tax=Myxococcus stipitatus (strain DSM 14675 / JCM 12634 / Mx s8) TaxID=1278073 RepID=L7UMZ6_MYXSD|nr:DUF1444 family protein [Myxococcus stipitatus]AGC48917.1 hypothetical protein MYSTI_07645 [Myxococcus stipitatus DSM 14675]